MNQALGSLQTMHSGLTGAACVPTPSTIGMEMNELETSLAELRKHIEELDNKACRFLRPSMPQPVSDDSNKLSQIAPPRSPHAEHITTLRKQVWLMTKYVRDITSRVDE